MPNIKIDKAVVGNDLAIGDIFEVAPTDHPMYVRTYKVISIEGNFLDCEEINLEEISTTYATELEVLEK